jgi:uncharacterized repeat protein (TIGR01451 family)
MEILKKETLRRDSVRALTGVMLVLAIVLATVAEISAAPPPPTWTRPIVAKVAIPEPDSLALGDTVEYFITVANPGRATPPDVVVDWYQVQATDVVSSALQIDPVSSDIVGYQGEEPVMQITDNTVVVTVGLLQPGDFFVFQIVGTVVGPLETGMVIVNLATVDYEDSEGSAGETIYSDPVTIPVDYYPLFLPIVLNSYEP